MARKPEALPRLVDLDEPDDFSPTKSPKPKQRDDRLANEVMRQLNKQVSGISMRSGISQIPDYSAHQQSTSKGKDKELHGQQSKAHKAAEKRQAITASSSPSGVKSYQSLELDPSCIFRASPSWRTTVSCVFFDC